MKPAGCPDESELSAFALGELSSADVDRLSVHLGTCRECGARLAMLDDRSNDAVLAIRRGAERGRIGRADERMAESRNASGDDFIGSLTRETPPPVEGPGMRIGPYRILEILGEGGFGSVFLAEQMEPVRREVALKLVKLGMDTRAVLARFAAERQALAMMDHPNIARVFDAGTTERGRPYFVMELAKGLPITEYCDDNKLSPRKRLDLFATVCDAVQHAHSKGVIHRDIKPTNVLITLRDGKPTPKVIDFGIAKAVGGRLTDQTFHTEMRHFIGTPQYMSPEQAEGSAMDVDTRTDVYSLGVLMYELLTGSTPFDPSALRSRGIDQIGRTLREIDPPKPSSRIAELGESTDAIASRRGTDARKLTQSLRGELDWIVMMCLEKDRTLRYETANAIAMDVRRYLKDLPVRAAPPSPAYQIRKFVRRHRASVAAVGAMAGAIVLGLALALFAWARASTERDNARAAERGEARERARAEQANADRDSADQARRRAQADAVATASPATALAFLDGLRTSPRDASDGGAALRSILDGFRQRLASSPAGSVERLRAACALAVLGDPPPPDLIDAVKTAPASEGRLVIGALEAAAAGKSPQAVALAPRLSGLADSEPDLRIRARYAITLTFLGDDRQTTQILAPAPDPTPCSAFISEFGQWHGDLSRLPAMLARLPDESRRGLCLAAGNVERQSLAADERKAVASGLGDLCARTPSPGVRAACEHTLREWGIDPAVVAPATPTTAPAPGQGWFVNRSGLTMMRVPAGFNVLGDERDGWPSIPAFFTRPMFVSARETPFSLCRQFADDPSVAPADRPRALSARHSGGNDVAVNMTILETAKFCNWLSMREGRRPVYSLPGETPTAWRCDLSADGYRLPNMAEWEYAARAGTTTRFPCSDDTEYLADFATASITSSRQGGRQPNRWGLFDMLGGVWEMCWEVNLFPPPPLAPGAERPRKRPATRPVIDPQTTDGGKVMIFRGGADDSGPYDMRVGYFHALPHDRHQASIGFRVVCAAPAETGTPIAPPEDSEEMWFWAAEMRPGNPILTSHGSDYALRVAHARGQQLHFAESARLFRKAMEWKPGDIVQWFYTAATCLEAGDLAGYSAACKAMQEIAAAESDAGPCERTAKLMLLNSGLAPGPDLDAARAMVDRAFQLGPDSPHIGWFLLDRGPAEYRAGHLEPAIRALEEGRSKVSGEAGQALGDMYLAMAYQRANKPADAKAAMARGAALLDQFAPLDAADWGGPWVDWLIARIAEREARQVLGLRANVRK